MREEVVVLLEKMYPDVTLPEYAHDSDSGADVKAYLSEDFLKQFQNGLQHQSAVYEADINNPIVFCSYENKYIEIRQGHWFLIPTGIKTVIPNGYEIQVRPRSGMALKKGVTVLNSPGTIDSGYRKEYGIILVNKSNAPFRVTHGDRIAQLVLMEVPKIKWEVVKEVEASERVGGFGHTGVT